MANEENTNMDVRALRQKKVNKLLNQRVGYM